jgi:two-component system, NarL family, response regulator DevR
MQGACQIRCVLIIGHDRRVRRGLSDLLTTETDLEICATAGSPRTALAHISAQRPDVALLDVLLPGPAQGLSLLQKLHTLGLPVVVLTTATSLRHQAQRSGAAAFLEKDGNLHLIPQALRAAAQANQQTRRQL